MLKLKKTNLIAIKVVFLEEVHIENIIVSNKFSSRENDTLLVIYTIIINLSHYIKCFQKWAHM